MTFCGKPVYKLCNSLIFIHRYFSFYMKLLLRPRTKRLIIPVGRETFGRNGPPGREVFGWNGPPGREAFGRNGPTDQKVFGQHDPRRGVRSVLRNTLHGPRVRAPGASLLRPARPRHSSPAHSKGPARFQLNERRIRAGPPVCVRIWTPHPSTGGLVSTGAESPRQPNFVVR